MRENIGLYRGKRKDNGKLVEGAYYKQTHYYGDPCKRHYIITSTESLDYDQVLEYYEVDPETVGEYTGLHDKNGKKIFEGDIFRVEDDMIAVVVFESGSFRMKIYGQAGTFTESGWDECGGGFGLIECEPIDWLCVTDMIIIGNIHDNPELLKGENNG